MVGVVEYAGRMYVDRGVAADPSSGSHSPEDVECMWYVVKRLHHDSIKHPPSGVNNTVHILKTYAKVWAAYTRLGCKYSDEIMAEVLFGGGGGGLGTHCRR